MLPTLTERSGGAFAPPLQASPLGRESAPSGLYRRQRGLRLRERPCLHGDRGRLRADCDLLAGGGVASLARLRCVLEADGELDDAADPNLLGVAELLENDLFQGLEHGLGVRLAQTCPVGYFPD
jgi:hypothetical protein